MNLLTVQEVSQKLKVSEDTVLTLIKSCQLPAAKIRRQWRVLETDLMTYFKSRSIESRKQLKKAS